MCASENDCLQSRKEGGGLAFSEACPGLALEWLPLPQNLIQPELESTPVVPALGRQRQGEFYYCGREPELH